MAQKPARLKTMNRDMAKSAYSARNQSFLGGISYWLLIALILSLGFGQLLRFDIYGLPIYLHDVLVILILALQLPRRLLNRNSWLQAKKGEVATSRSLLVGLKLFIFGLALGWIRVLTLYPISELIVPFLYTLRLLSYLALYFVIKHKEIKINKIYFLVSTLICCIIGLLQYFILPDMRVFQYLGWDDHLNRLTLTHFDPTFTAVMLGLALLITPLSRWYVSLLLSFAILLTYSRSVWLSLALTFSFFMIKNKKFNLLIIGICLLVIPIFFLPKKFGEGTNLLRTFSITSRFESDISYFKKYKWDLLIGRGMNTMILDSAPSKYSDHSTGPNNSYLYLLATTGLIGLIGWGMFMHSLYLKSSHKPMLIFFFIASLFNNVMFYPFALLWILLIESNSKSL